ncbi:MAG: DUF4430 domain-containing protein [Gaiellaceae bacterium]
MFRSRLLALLTALALAATLVPLAQGALVRVRVEGKTATLFGASEPRASGANPLEALESASVAGEFYYHVTPTSFGPYVDQIGRYAGSESTGWVFKVNGVSPPVGADKVELKDGDTVLWYHATFGPTGGPPTLHLSRAAGGCYRVAARDDAGKALDTTGVFLQVDGRIVRTQAGRACPGPHRGLVKAVRGGYVRSNALP